MEAEEETRWEVLKTTGCLTTVFPSFSRPGLNTCLCLRLHRRHVCCGLPPRVCLLLLPSLPDVSGTDHQGVVFDSAALQSRNPGQPASCSGPSLVPLLALPTYPLTSARRWDTVPGHRITGTHPVTAALNVDRTNACDVMVILILLGTAARKSKMSWMCVGRSEDYLW